MEDSTAFVHFYFSFFQFYSFSSFCFSFCPSPTFDFSKAEARLAQRRQARAEAREIRMRELERQQKEQEQNADRAFDMQTSAGIDPLVRTRTSVGSLRGGTMSSRRSSEDSLEEDGRSLRDVRLKVSEFF